MKKKGNNLNSYGFFKKRFIITGVTLLSFIIMFQYKYYEVLEINNKKVDFKQSSKLFWARLIFGRTRSRITGKILNMQISPYFRSMIYNPIIKYLDINKDEIKYPIQSYKSIGDLFSRYIREETRPIEDVDDYSILSPCDSEIIDYGELKSEYIENVKGIRFSVKNFLGENLEKKFNDGSTKFYYAIFYLSPKKYHHFHSPSNFQIKIRRHISGELFPVFQGMFKFINNLFNINERVILAGEWKGGNMYYAAISAYNVGNIKIINDDELVTNKLRTQLSYMGGDIDSKIYDNYEIFEAGDELGEFKMGSSIILIFENKNNFSWNVQRDQSIFVGQRVGGVNSIKKQEKFIKFKN